MTGYSQLKEARMIKYSGEMAEKTKKFIVKAQAHAGTVATIITSCIFSIPITLVTIYYDYIFAIAYIMLPIVIICGSIPLSRKKWDTVCPLLIAIDGDDIVCEGKDFRHVRSTEDIKSIKDYGDFYQILFYFPHKSLVFVCQKDLIVEGTIEEFEERFADYIVRKTK